MQCLEERPNPPEVFLPDLLGALKDFGSSQSPAFESLLAEIGGPHGRRKGIERDPVGFALFSPVFWPEDLCPALFVKEIYIQPAYRGQGLGHALMAGLARIALQRQWRRLFLGVERTDARALAFYERLPGGERLKADLFGFTDDGLLALADRL